ncbi:18995_t:CDS:1, partial [Racocetra fulgida]
MAPEPALLKAIHFLQNPIPQYVLGTLPAIAIMGTTPNKTLLEKLTWVLQCLGCPFIGLFYFCNVGSKIGGKVEYETVEMCVYWLASKCFIQGNKDDADKIDADKIDANKVDAKNKGKKKVNTNNGNDEQDIISVMVKSSDSNELNSENKETNGIDKGSSSNGPNSNDEEKIIENGNQTKKKAPKNENQDKRPVGYHAMRLHPTSEQRAIFTNWVANASLLDRLASLASAYYILVGIFAGISKAAGPCMEDNSLEDWPFIPLLFIWALPIIYVRISNGKVVYKLSEDSFPDQSILVTDFDVKDRHKKKLHVAITALASVALAWLAVIIAYYTPPIGFFCR